MRIKSTLIITFFAIVFFVATFSAVGFVGKPIAEAQARKIDSPPDPFDQLLQSQRAGGNQTAVNVAMLIVTIVLVSVGWYALSERTTKAMRAARALTKPVRRVPQIQQAQVANVPQIQGSDPWRNSP